MRFRILLCVLVLALSGCLSSGDSGSSNARGDEPPGDGGEATRNLESEAAAWFSADAALAPSSGEDAKPRAEVSVAVDPANPSRMVGAWIEWGNDPTFVCCSRGVWRVATSSSMDGGASWTYGGQMPPIGHDGSEMTCDDRATFDPWVTFDRQGIAYISYASTGAGIPTVSNPCEESTLAVARSVDGGTTWATPIVVARSDTTCFADRDAITSDPVSGTIYVTWSGLGCAGDPIFLSRSVDGGLTWSAEVAASASDDASPYGGSPRVGPDGTLYVAYYRSTAFDRCPYVIGTGAEGIMSAEAVVAISRDQGATFERTVAGFVCDAEYQTLEQPFNGAAEFSWPLLAVDPGTGRLAVAWINRDTPVTAVRVAVSEDGARTWSDPSAIADAPRSAFMPALAADAGLLRLAYVSMLSTGQYDVLYRESEDGTVWSEPTALDTGEACNCWGSLNGPYMNGGGIGHYIGIDAAAGGIIVAWPDNRDIMGWQTIYSRGGTYAGASWK